MGRGRWGGGDGVRWVGRDPKLFLTKITNRKRVDSQFSLSLLFPVSITNLLIHCYLVLVSDSGSGLENKQKNC